MAITPIIVALRRHKAGALLIGLQIALTLAIVCNALFIITSRIERIGRPTGIDETDLFKVSVQRTGLPSDGEAAKTRLDADVREDLAAIRGLPDVADAYVTNTLPLANSNWTGWLGQSPDGNKVGPATAFFLGDEHTLSTLGLHLVAGRNFRPDEVLPHGLRDRIAPAQLIISRALAQKLYADGDAVGKTVYVGPAAPPTRIIGVVDRLQSSSLQPWAEAFAWQTSIVPARFSFTYRSYAIRARPGRLDAAMKAVPDALYAVDPQRVIPEDDGVLSFAAIRAQAYRADRGMALLMGAVCVILLTVTAAGVVGLSSFWVGQRRRQIGVRRALGATRLDILNYFLAENALITCGGVAVGALLAFAINAWLMAQFELARLSASYVAVGIVVLVLLGQAAAFAPALRASRISPVEATRS
jgi:putative ABC transport system permease protein